MELYQGGEFKMNEKELNNKIKEKKYIKQIILSIYLILITCIIQFGININVFYPMVIILFLILNFIYNSICLFQLDYLSSKCT